MNNKGILIHCAHRYLGLYETEIEAAMAYDREAIRHKGLQALTNFDISMYTELMGMSIQLKR